MPTKLIFLSHIHEEKELAIVIKDALEAEFSGFVDVFVSSDGVSIPAGANFLKRIEDGLVSCVGAVYLISPVSVKRNWINFELGAVWVRSEVSVRSGGPEIPALPVCHSGMSPDGMPSPLNNLNGITASQAASLEFGFRSLQAAVGGRGKLRTDFDALAQKAIDFETRYTMGSTVAKLVRLITPPGQAQDLIRHCEQQTSGATITVECGFMETASIQLLQALEANELKGLLTVKATRPGLHFGASGAFNGAQVELALPADLILKHKAQITLS